MNPDDNNIKELRNNLNLDFSLGPSQAKKSKYENCVLETPEFARIALADTLSAHNKKMRYDPNCILGTPDMAKIALSTPELDRLAANSMRTDFQLQTPSLNTFLRNDDDDDDKKIERMWANSTKATAAKPKEEIDEVKFVPNSSRFPEDIKPNVDQLNMNQDGLAPIDMVDQERIKLERKRARNRVAASKCRQRKLERISKLQERVNKYNSKNEELARYICVVENIIGKLNDHILEHRERGCDMRHL